MASAPFTLTKWYLDCVAPDGRAVIGYWASLAWRSLAFTWQNVVLYESGQPPVRRSSLVPAPPPEVGSDTITWRAPALACVMRVESRQRPIEERLLDGDTGVVEWRAEAPAAVVSVELRGFAPVQGPGYAERIFMTGAVNPRARSGDTSRGSGGRAHPLRKGLLWPRRNLAGITPDFHGTIRP